MVQIKVNDMVEIKDFCEGGKTKVYKVIATRTKEYGVPGDCSRNPCTSM